MEMPEACDFVVFGGTGDLALRKLLPALYMREHEGQLPPATRIVGVSLQDHDDASYRLRVRAALAEHLAPGVSGCWSGCTT
jgi:glucose-6-phosphate 1-dehydrogenase